MLLGFGLLTACAPPPEKLEDADKAVVAEERATVDRTSKETIVWCTYSQATHSSGPQSAPVFVLRTDRPNCDGPAGCEVTFTAYENQWCFAGGIEWGRNSFISFEAANQAALKADALQGWYAPMGAVVSEVAQGQPQFIIQERHGIFRATFVDPVGQIIIFRERGGVFVPDTLVPNLSEVGLENDE